MEKVLVRIKIFEGEKMIINTKEDFLLLIKQIEQKMDIENLKLLV